MRYSVTGVVETGLGALEIIGNVVRSLEDATEFSTGGAYGVDSMAAILAHNPRVASVLRLCAPAGCLYNRRILLYVDTVEQVHGGYMKRNDALVEHCDVLLAFPRTTQEQLRSGTWSTVRRARKAGKEVRIYPLEQF